MKRKKRKRIKLRNLFALALRDTFKMRVDIGKKNKRSRKRFGKHDVDKELDS